MAKSIQGWWKCDDWTNIFSFSREMNTWCDSLATSLYSSLCNARIDVSFAHQFMKMIRSEYIVSRHTDKQTNDQGEIYWACSPAIRLNWSRHKRAVYFLKYYCSRLKVAFYQARSCGINVVSVRWWCFPCDNRKIL